MMKGSKTDQQQQRGQKQTPIDNNEQELEILKAVAQARQGRAGSSRSMSEFDAHRLKFTQKPSRFRTEAMRSRQRGRRISVSDHWDFRQSLLDSYEIVAVSKRIEQGGLVIENEIQEDGMKEKKKKKDKKKGESMNSLRNLFNLVSSKWYNNNNHDYDESD